MKAPFETYKEIFGQVGKGVHQYRFMGTAIVDYIMTIIGSIFFSYVLKVPLELMTFLVFGLGIILHILFGVETNTTKYLGIRFT